MVAGPSSDPTGTSGAAILPAVGPQVPGLTAAVHEGRPALEALADALDDLADRTGASMSVRARWLCTWARHQPAWTPWVVTVARPDGTLCGAVPLARRRRVGMTRMTTLGHGSTDVFSPPHDGEAARDALVDALLAQLRGLSGPWHLSLRQVLSGDPVLAPVVAALPAATVTPGMPAPTTRFDRGRDLSAYTSRNYRSQANHKWNRLTRDGHAPQVVRARSWDEVRDWLPAVERVAVKRDREIAGRSRLDDPAYAAFFRDLLATHAHAGELDLAVLAASGAVAAYSVSFLDGSAYRQWNKHHDSDWAPYRPGQVLDARLLAQALADPCITEFDWMAGAEPYKLRTATDVVRTVDVVVAGNGAQWLTVLPAVRHRVRLASETRPSVRWAWDRAKRARRWWRDVRQ